MAPGHVSGTPVCGNGARRATRKLPAAPVTSPRAMPPYGLNWTPAFAGVTILFCINLLSAVKGETEG